MPHAAPLRLLLLGAFTLVLVSLVGCGCPTGPTETITIKDRTFTLDVADTGPLVARGLGGRESIPEDGGMLFVFPDAEVRTFYMRDCLIDIDIAFLDPLGRVTAIHTMPAVPLQGETESDLAYDRRLARYSSVRDAQYAVELRAGTFALLGLQTGDKIALPLDCLKARVANADF